MSATIFARSDFDEDEVEEDEGTLQRRAFPIGEPSMRVGDDSLPPGDGMEYLRRVRNQQRELPATVTAVVSPERLARRAKTHSQVSNGKQAPSLHPANAPKGLLAALAASPLPPPPLPPALQPRATWQRKVLADFAILREQVQRRRQKSSVATVEKSADLPDANDYHGWELWCGLSGNGRSSRPSKVRSVSTLDQQRIKGLLRALHIALQRSEEHSEGGGEDVRVVRGVDRHCQWAFAALACLDSAQLLDPDVCASVRGLFSACVEWRARLLLGWRRGATTSEAAEEEQQQQQQEHQEERSSQEQQPPHDDDAQLAALHVLVTICGGFFKQAPSEEWQGADGALAR